MAELVDAHDSGSCARKGVEVRVFSSAPLTNVRGKSKLHDLSPTALKLAGLRKFFSRYFQCGVLPIKIL